MLFPTVTFAVFFLIVLPVSWSLMRHQSAWRLFILAASFVFYAWWDWRFVLLLAGCTLWNQLLAVRIWRSTVTSQKRALLILALAGDLGVLGYFKYYDFFVTSTNNLFALVGVDLPLEARSNVLPVGISFFTFMAIAYIVDVYRGDFEPVRFGPFAAYLSFFPHLVAGPIVRPGELIPQMSSPRDPRYVDTSRAFFLVGTGLGFGGGLFAGLGGGGGARGGGVGGLLRGFGLLGVGGGLLLFFGGRVVGGAQSCVVGVGVRFIHPMTSPPARVPVQPVMESTVLELVGDERAARACPDHLGGREDLDHALSFSLVG